MSRPPSIVRFERLYLASFALGLIGWAVSWTTLSQRFLQRLAADPATAGFGWILPAAVVLGAAITLLLLYLVAHRASVVAKWVVVALTALALLRFLVNLPAAMQGLMTSGELILSVATLAVSVVATAHLFRPDARAWFGEDVHGDATDGNTMNGDEA